MSRSKTNFSLVLRLGLVSLFAVISNQTFSQSINKELDSILLIVLKSKDKDFKNIELSNSQIENKSLKKIILSQKSTEKDVLILTEYIHKSKRFSPDDLTNFLDLFISKPTRTDFVDIDYVKIKWFEISGHRDNNDLAKANNLQSSLKRYLASIKTKNHDLERAEIYASEYDIVIHIIQNEIEEGIALCNKNEKIASRIGDTSLIIQSIYNRCEFYVVQGLLPEFIKESEHCLHLDSVRQNKSEYYMLNLMHLVDAYIYQGINPQRSLKLLELIHNDKDYSIDSYAYYAKFLASINPADELALDVFQMVHAINMNDFFVKTNRLVEKNLYPIDYYQFLRESAHALVNFGHSKEGILAMEMANRVNQKIYSTDLTNALVKQEVNILKHEKNLELKYTQKISNIYRITLIIGSALLLGILVLLIRKVKQNKVLAQKNEMIKKQDDEKALLMSELHHRVKNNFQIISSLLSTQAKNIEDEEMKNILTESQSRITSMALTHEKLYGSANFEYQLDNYLISLYNDLIDIFKTTNSKLHLKINTEAKIDIDMAIPLGLIFNETITNSLKYGKHTDDSVEIFITVIDQNGYFDITYTDSGDGISESINFPNAESMGLRLINRLTRQLEGTVKYTNKKFSFRFPKP